MTDDGTKRLLSELTNILIESYDEIGEAEQGQNGFNPYEMLENMLVGSRKTIEKGDVAWDSVFWIDENCRPDVVCHEVNDIFSKLSTEDQDKLASEFSKEREGRIDSSSERGKKRLTDLKCLLETSKCFVLRIFQSSWPHSLSWQSRLITMDTLGKHFSVFFVSNEI